MTNKKLIFPIIFPLIVVIFIILYEILMKATGIPVVFNATGYDPRDLLRGHYIRYVIDEKGELSYEELVEMEITKYKEHNLERTYYNFEGYALLADSNNDGVYDGFGTFSLEKPDKPYLKCNFRVTRNDDIIQVNLQNEDRNYYVNEKLAPILEQQIDDTGGFLIYGTVNNGSFRASGIQINDFHY